MIIFEFQHEGLIAAHVWGILVVALQGLIDARVLNM